MLVLRVAFITATAGSLESYRRHFCLASCFGGILLERVFHGIVDVVIHQVELTADRMCWS